MFIEFNSKNYVAYSCRIGREYLIEFNSSSIDYTHLAHASRYGFILLLLSVICTESMIRLKYHRTLNGIKDAAFRWPLELHLLFSKL